MATDWHTHRQQLHFRDVDRGGLFSSTPFSRLSESEYFHLSCSYDGAKFTTYINGKIEDSEDVGNFVGVISGEIRVGKMPWDGGNDGLNGSIDDIRIYNRALSNQEVAALYELDSTLPPGEAPVITHGLRDYELMVDQTLSLAVQHTGDHPVAYQWFFNDIPIAEGGDGPSLVIHNAVLEDTGRYRLQVRSLWGEVSSSAYVQVLSPPKILQQPRDLVAGLGGDLLLGVQVLGTPPVTYQWFKNGRAIAGAEGPALHTGDLGASDEGIYKVVVGNAYGEVESREAVVTIGAGLMVRMNDEGVAVIMLRTKIDGIWVVEASSDLKEWVEVNAMKTTDGVAETTDIRSLINEMRFYRAQLLE